MLNEMTAYEKSMMFLDSTFNTQEQASFYQYNVLNLRFHNWQKSQNSKTVDDLVVHVIAKAANDNYVRKNVRSSAAAYLSAEFPNEFVLIDSTSNYLNSMSMISIICKKSDHGRLTELVNSVDLEDVQKLAKSSLKVSDRDKLEVQKYVEHVESSNSTYFIRRQSNEVELDFKDYLEAHHVELDDVKTSELYLSNLICERYNLKKALSIMSVTKIDREDLKKKYANVARTYAYKPLVYDAQEYMNSKKEAG